MPWIKVIAENEAPEPLRQLYAANREKDGSVDNILQVHSLDAQGLRAHLGLYKSVMHGPGPLSRLRREMIALSVSALNHCHY